MKPVMIDDVKMFPVSNETKLLFAEIEQKNRALSTMGNLHEQTKRTDPVPLTVLSYFCSIINVLHQKGYAPHIPCATVDVIKKYHFKEIYRLLDDFSSYQEENSDTPQSLVQLFKFLHHYIKDIEAYQAFITEKGNE